VTAVALELLSRRPASGAAPTPAPTMPALDPFAVELVADTDTLLTMCACNASIDQPY
jgi:hypothetical protein